jgi:hypothetical protein
LGLALHRESGDEVQVTLLPSNLGLIAYPRQNHAHAVRLLEESIVLCRATGNTHALVIALSARKRMAGHW